MFYVLVVILGTVGQVSSLDAPIPAGIASNIDQILSTTAAI
jgi:hypothetical protein